MLTIKCPSHTQNPLGRGLEDDPEALHLMGLLESGRNMREDTELEEVDESY